MDKGCVLYVISKSGLTKKGFADKIGCNYQTVLKWVSGKSEVSWVYQQKIRSHYRSAVREYNDEYMRIYNERLNHIISDHEKV